MSEVIIIEFPSNLGLKEPTTGKEPGVKKLPEWLKKHHFHKFIAPVGIETLTAPMYSNVADSVSGVLNADSLVYYSQQEANLINKHLTAGKFPLVLGGDCSIALGTALALKQKGNFGLFYIDGHTDFMEPKHSQTGGVGGMAAAMVAGVGPQKLTNINGMSPYIREEYVWCVGNREYDEDYESVIRNSAARYLSLYALRETGIEKTLDSFLEVVDVEKLDGFWVHIDVDVLDDEIMPAVDSRTSGGLSYGEFDQMIYLLLSSPKISGMEITILDPDLDPSGIYTKEFVSHFTKAFNKAMKN